MPNQVRSNAGRSLAAVLAVGLAAASVVLSASPASAAQTTLAPTSITSTRGAVASGQTVANLAVQDQTGTQDTFSKYVEFTTPSTGYSGYRSYTVPSSTAPSSVTGISVAANYKGPTNSEQAWTWAMYNWSTATWTTLGTNAGASSWVWKKFTFASPSSAANYVSTSGVVQVRLSSTTGVDNALLDFESITVEGSTSTADTTAPSAPTSVTSPGKTATSVDLAWAASTDNVAVTGYDVYTGSTKVASVSGTSATVSGLTANTGYSFTVRAKDAAGNLSASSAALSVTTSPATNTSIVLPPANGKWDYQIGGPYTPAAGVQTVSRDRTVPPVPGLYNICYVNVMQTQPDEQGQSTTNPPYGTTAWWLKFHPNVVLKNAAGTPIIDAKWNEVVFDVRTASQRAELASVQKPWIQGCKDAGYQAIEPDNIDAEVRSSGFLTHADVRAYMKILVPYAHSIGLAIGQKNAITDDKNKAEWKTDGPSFVTVGGVTQGFDFAVAEECGAFDECAPFVTMYGGRVLVVEYTNDGYTKGCTDWKNQLSVIQRNEDVRPSSESEFIYKEC